MHRSITLVDFQLDAQNSYLFTYNTFIKILYMFRALPCSSSGGLRRNCIYMQPLVSSLSAGDCLVMHGQPIIKICNVKQARQIHQHKKIKIKLYKTMRPSGIIKPAGSTQDSHLQRVTIPETAYKHTGQSLAESDDTRDCIYTDKTVTCRE